VFSDGTSYDPLVSTSPKPKVLVAMSGGVDSSVAAALLQREGYDVVGCFMRLGSPGESLDQLMPASDACDAAALTSSAPPPGKTVKIGHQGCCSILDAADARLVAARLEIPFYVCNFKKDFGRIIDYFVDEYAMGRTPNPCVRCNDWLKFGKLHDYAMQIGADFVASGHYARIDRSHATPRLLRGVDASKDQSYVLFGAPRERLAQMLLPIGAMQKHAVRDLAQQWGLPVFDKPDSQEICFVPDNDYAGLVEQRRPDLHREGQVVDTAGNVLGSHAGQHQFTIGQRRGLNIALGHRIYVVAKHAATNRVVVGEERDLLVASCIAGEPNWLLDPIEPGQSRAVLAKYRYNTPPAAARVSCVACDHPAHTHPTGPSGRTGAFMVTFETPQLAVAEGQAIVLYDAANPDHVLAGGWIASTARVDSPGDATTEPSIAATTLGSTL
jgi:tRNA-uridine 2-sulfurtransferase